MKTRLSKLESGRRDRFRQYLDSLSNDELDALIKDYDERFPLSAEWFATLTDGELDIVCSGKPGAKAIEKRYYEFINQNKETRKEAERKAKLLRLR